MKRNSVLSTAAVSMLLLLLPVSCSKDKTAEPQPAPGDALASLDAIRPEADAQWQALVDESFENVLVEMEMRPPRAPRCNCSYRILSFEADAYDEVSKEELPVELKNPPIDAVLWSSATCVENKGYTCNLFSGVYLRYLQNRAVEPEHCYEYWKSLPPEGRFDFNCKVPSFSTFPVNFGTPANNLQNWKITFEIYCQDAQAMTGCDLDDGYGYVSEPITISYPGNAQAAYWGQTFVQLQGCGCDPKEVVFH